jgi:hypothetical protein
VAPVRTDVSEERIASILRVTRIRELGKALEVKAKQMIEVIKFPEASFLASARRCLLPEHDILHIK